MKPSTLRLNHPDRRRLVSEPVGKQCRGPSVEAFLFGQSPGNWAYPASPSESTLRLQVHLSIRTGSSLLTLDHVEPPSVHNNRPVGKWAIPPGLSIYPRAAPLGSSHHHCHPRCHTKLEVEAFSIIELVNYWLDTATTDIIAGRRHLSSTLNPASPVHYLSAVYRFDPPSSTNARPIQEVGKLANAVWGERAGQITRGGPSLKRHEPGGAPAPVPVQPGITGKRTCEARAPSWQTACCATLNSAS